MDCPLCLEEIDISDANFKPCPCGYQICRFCWHHIKSNLNGRCPACRRKYSDTMIEFKPMSQDEIKKLSQAKKQKEREKRELEQMNRKHLANMRVVQKNLVYVVGMDPKLAREELIPTLRSQEYFGQYGRISKILISKRTTASKLIMGTQESAIGVYVTYLRKEDAARAIIAIDGSKGPDGRTIRASYGTTKYCTTYLRNLPCTNPICTYLHEPGEEADSFTKEDLTTLRHAAKDTESRARPTPAPGSFGNMPRSDSTPMQPAVHNTPVPSAPAAIIGDNSSELSALPKTASWATQKIGTPGSAAPSSAQPAPAPASPGNAIRDQDLPPLSVLPATQSQRKQQQYQQQQQLLQQGRLSQSPASKMLATTQKPKGRPATPTSIRAESPVPYKDGGSPAPTAPPGLVKSQPTADLVATQGSPQPNRAKEHSLDDTVPAPPGLLRHGAPPGLTSRSATPSQETASSTSEAKTSAYQPSSNAQAVLDDMRLRRDTAASQPVKSPFPDFDKTLNSFRDGEDFSFAFEEGVVPAHLKGPVANRAGALGAFAPFSLGHAIASPSLSGGARSSGPADPGYSSIPPPPGLGAAGVHGENDADPPTYSGRFDPFAPGAGETLLSDNTGSASSPFTAIEEMHRSLSDERASAGEGGPNGDGGGEDESSASRFGFAKQKESLRTSDDLLGFIKRGANVASMGVNGDASHGGASNGNFAGSALSGMGGLASAGFPGSNVIPSYNPQADWRTGQSGQRDSPLSALLPQHQQQHQGMAGSRNVPDAGYFGNGLSDASRGAAAGTPGGRQDSLLLAHLMNRRGNDAPPFQDPAIMSFTQQQRNQPHQQQQQQHASMGSGHGSTPSSYHDFSAPGNSAGSVPRNNGESAASAAASAIFPQFRAGGGDGPHRTFV